MFRSILFVPGDRPDRFDKAVAAGSDLTVLDLEDAVSPEGKARARDLVTDYLRAARGGRVAVRINASGTEWHDADMAALAAIDVDLTIMVPKAEEAALLTDLAASRPGGTRLIALVETALGLWNALDVARAAGVSQLAFGSVDFILDAGIPADTADALHYARSQLVVASAAAGIAPPIDGVTLAVKDTDGLAADVAAAKALGFGGKLCIHPSQVASVNAGFSPSDEDIAIARSIVEAAGRAEGIGAISHNGKLIDRPVVERARRVLAQIAG